ncbi:hypothetical protein F441_05774 [Phytophthora nicotianae CJ01A1]|uniref:Uncharacterized protein n=3 Tax=Phytophthora nicotianae TaxID=4792 RepID=V9FK13_PHYNI|nr:hypothetical protein F443_05769 [Phytophthora nicotianae P1569]ETK90642.1 hypothetical protein L915_05636 [Phytophthora nicotianae]ETP20518.1 hypothetical protein F441_05774 [Phytophthora nicotianae CJ01A1]ETL44044.1 hypothetical protein L916_05574 [Phytophthora nicotianae]ETL97216.1 hypothetical protein L917_05461 [Phytophthora nicotianae]
MYKNESNYVIGKLEAVMVVFFVRAGRRGGYLASTLLSGGMASFQAEMGGQKGLWTDDIITAKRILQGKEEIAK